MLLPAYDLSFYEFDEENDPKNYGVLLCDVVHGKPPMKPLYIGIGWYWYYHGIRYGAETLFFTHHAWLGFKVCQRLSLYYCDQNDRGRSQGT